MLVASALSLFPFLRLVSGHIAPWHPSMWGYNVTFQTFDYDNRPVVPLADLTFDKWWWHNHLQYPPHPDDVFQLPAGQPATVQLACNKGATTYYASSDGGNIQNPDKPNDPCPGSPPSQYHTKDESDVKGCALGIVYKSDVSQVKPEDITIFSVNHTCVWNRYTDFQVPKNMPPCPNGKCLCTWHWIHSPDSGSEQMYMNGFQCNIANSVSNVPLATPQVARRCGADPDYGRPNAVPGNCTYGAKQPLYWLQQEGNNMFEGYYAPPFYNDLYNFRDGAQDDIFQNYYKSIPVPGPTQTELPVPNSPGATTTNSSTNNAAHTSGGNSTTPAASSPTTASGNSTTPAASSPTTSHSGNSTTPAAPSSTHSGNGTTPTASSRTTAGGNSTTPAVSSPTPSGNSTTSSHSSPASSAGSKTPTVSSTPPSTNTPSTSPSNDAGSNSQCPGVKRSTSAFSRRHDSVERRSPFSHKGRRYHQA